MNVEATIAARERRPEADITAAEVGVSLARRGAAAIVALERAGRHNAINAVMHEAIDRSMVGMANDATVYGVIIRAMPAGDVFAGSDFLELHGRVQSQPADARRDLARQCSLAWRMECFNKPTVSLIDGLVSGAGVGLTLFGTHRVAGPGYRFQIGESAIGLATAFGAAHVLARLPRQIGVYLGLTGRMIGPADAYMLGLVTHCIASAHFADIETRFADADPVDPVLDDRHVAPGAAPLEGCAETIARCFAGGSVEEIRARLVSERANRDWCAAVLADLDRCSPLSLKVALHHIRRCRHLDLRHSLIVDHRITSRLVARHDFSAAVRAAVDAGAALQATANRPSWRPARLEDVTENMLESVFAPMPGDELVLPTIQEM